MQNETFRLDLCIDSPSERLAFTSELVSPPITITRQFPCDRGIQYYHS